MTYRDEPDLRARCPHCHQLGEPASPKDVERSGFTRYCPCTTAGTYFGRPPSPVEQEQ